MKHLKKWAAVLLCAALVFTLSVPALAGDGFMNEGTFYNHEGATFVNNGPFQNNGAMHNEGAFSNLGRLFGDGLAKWLKPMTANSGRNEMAAPKQNFGTGLSWMISEAGELSITGSGAMPNYSASQAPWEKYWTLIERVTVGDGITSIGDFAFFNLNEVKTITIGSTVETIGVGAFECCYSLASAVLPSSVKSIKSHAFQETGLTSMMLPARLTNIGESAFYGCDKLTSVRYGGTISTFTAMSIGYKAFPSQTTVSTADTTSPTITVVNATPSLTDYTDVPYVSFNGNDYYYDATSFPATSATYISTAGDLVYDIYLNSEDKVIKYTFGEISGVADYTSSSGRFDSYPQLTIAGTAVTSNVQGFGKYAIELTEGLSVDDGGNIGGGRSVSADSINVHINSHNDNNAPTAYLGVYAFFDTSEISSVLTVDSMVRVTLTLYTTISSAPTVTGEYLNPSVQGWTALSTLSTRSSGENYVIEFAYPAASSGGPCEMNLQLVADDIFQRIHINVEDRSIGSAYAEATSFSDLKTKLASYDRVYYNGSALTLTENLKIPEGKAVEMYNTAVTIPNGVTLELVGGSNSAAYLDAGKLIVESGGSVAATNAYTSTSSGYTPAIWTEGGVMFKEGSSLAVSNGTYFEISTPVFVNQGNIDLDTDAFLQLGNYSGMKPAAGLGSTAEFYVSTTYNSGRIDLSSGAQIAVLGSNVQNSGTITGSGTIYIQGDTYWDASTFSTGLNADRTGFDNFPATSGTCYRLNGSITNVDSGSIAPTVTVTNESDETTP